MFFHCCYDSPFGAMTLFCDEKSLMGAWFVGQKYFAAGVPSLGEERPDSPILRLAAEWLSSYFGGARPEAGALSLAPQGSEFRRTVWDALLEIPYGCTAAYGEIAGELSKKAGRNVSARAVGGAVAHNPISVFIPCHRVVGGGGSLTGYAGGIDRKVALLKLEGVDVSRFFIP